MNPVLILTVCDALSSKHKMSKNKMSIFFCLKIIERHEYDVF